LFPTFSKCAGKASGDDFWYRKGAYNPNLQQTRSKEYPSLFKRGGGQKRPQISGGGT